MNRLLLAAALAVVTPAALLAHEPGATGDRYGHGEGMFKRWDTNNDGVVSRDEAQAAGSEHVAKMFDAQDVNKDGKLTADEMRDAHGAMKQHFGEKFKAADQDADGNISRQEAAQGMPTLAKHFDDVDTDKNGFVTAEELQAHFESMHHGEHHAPAETQPEQQ